MSEVIVMITRTIENNLKNKKGYRNKEKKFEEQIISNTFKVINNVYFYIKNV